MIYWFLGKGEAAGWGVVFALTPEWLKMQEEAGHLCD